jgi:hypothetical protein
LDSHDRTVLTVSSGRRAARVSEVAVPGVGVVPSHGREGVPTEVTPATGEPFATGTRWVVVRVPVEPVSAGEPGRVLLQLHE